jgi:hypothetical protein
MHATMNLLYDQIAAGATGRGVLIDYLRRARFFSSKLDVVAIESWGGVDRSR